MNNLIVLNQNDNVGVSQFIIPEKTKIEGHEISTLDPIPFGHKVCLKSINKGDPIIKYDQIIGFALNDIKPGEHVHSHNLEFREFKRDFKITDKKNIINEKADTFFNGILRDNGDVATRNYIGIVSTVNCSATVTKRSAATPKAGLAVIPEYPSDPPHCNASVRWLTGCEVLSTLLASLSKFLICENTFSTIFLVPPSS